MTPAAFTHWLTSASPGSRVVYWSHPMQLATACGQLHASDVREAARAIRAAVQAAAGFPPASDFAVGGPRLVALTQRFLEGEDRYEYIAERTRTAMPARRAA